MLIEFRLSNFRSIREPQVLSMVAGPGKNELPQNLSKPDFNADFNLVRSAVIYGANAAGKSNLIQALDFMQQMVINSAKESQQGEKIKVDSFLFDKNTKSKPSLFEVTFSKDKVRYQYGFSLDKNRIFDEWLFAYPSGRMQQWFTREYSKEKNEYLWKFSKFFTGKKQLWKESTRSNALFLSTAIQLNNEQLIPIFDWFSKDLVVISAFKMLPPIESFKQLDSLSGKKQMIKYLNIADPSISDVLLEFEKISKDHLPRNMSDNLKGEFTGKEKVTVGSIHKVTVGCIHNENSPLKLSEESHGTRKIFELAGYWIDALDKGKIIIVDELDNGLHPLTVRFLISLIYDHKINKHKSQLIFSTHDTSLLDKDIFRRDQIWFVEKDKHHSTQLYPLLDFSPRSGEAIGRGYLQGRYGAIPYIGNWRF